MKVATKYGGFSKGPARLSIEAALRDAKEPLSAWQISDITGVNITLTSTHIGNCVNQRLAYNVHPRECPPGAYVWGQPDEVEAPANVVRGRTQAVSGTYKGEAATPTRPGSQDAYLLPSLHEGERIERRPPLLMSGRVEPLGLRG